MNIVTRSLFAGIFALCFTFTVENDANAQYPVAVQPVVPAVVGYTAERRGLFGRRVVYRPIVAAATPAVAVAPVTVARPVVTVARPVVTVARPVVTVARPVVTVARPVVAPVTSYYAPSAPVTSYYAPSAPVTSYYAPSAPVTSYYAPSAPVAVPVQTYRVPVTTYMPVIGF